MTFKQTHFPIFFEAPSLLFPFFKPIRKLFPSSLTFITPAPRNRSSANLFLSSFGVGAEGRGWWRGRGGATVRVRAQFPCFLPSHLHPGIIHHLSKPGHSLCNLPQAMQSPASQMAQRRIILWAVACVQLRARLVEHMQSVCVCLI